jgi:hypothetical protein
MFQDRTKLPEHPTRLDRLQIVQEARSWLGRPFRHQGREWAHGVDCVGLVIKIQSALDPSWEYDVTDYRREPKQQEFIQNFRDLMVEKNPADRLPGDVLLMRDRRFTCHCVVYDVNSSEEYIIHSYALRRKVVEEPLSAEWKNNITHCFEFKGIVD